MSTFAARLQYSMEQAGLNQTALAEKTGASKAAISQYLSGKNLPSLARMQVLAEAIGTSLEYLKGYRTPPEPPRAPEKKITVTEAARCMGKSFQFVRNGLQQGILPFGNAVPGTGKHWNYYISPARFRDYVGAEAFNRFFGLTSEQEVTERSD